MIDYQPNACTGNAAVVMPAKLRGPLRVAHSCGIVPGHEHDTQADAWECIARTLQVRLKEKITAWREEGRVPLGSGMERVKPDLLRAADEIEDLLSSGPMTAQEEGEDY